MSENGEIYTTGKNFTLPPAVTAWTNLTSVAPLSNFPYFLKRVVYIVVYYELEFLIFKQPELRTGVVQLSQSQMAVYNNKAQLANPC